LGAVVGVFALLVAGLVLAPATPASAAQSKPRIVACVEKVLFKPTGPDQLFNLWCLGSGGLYQGSRWSVWNQRRAVGDADNLSTAGPSGRPVRLTFSKPRLVNGRRVFTKVVIRRVGSLGEGENRTTVQRLSFRQSQPDFGDRCVLIWVQDGYPDAASAPVCRTL
jgi:hypothetical protein